MSGSAAGRAAAGGSRFTRFLNHPAGPKTIHFWAPFGKWCLVLAGLKDINRPAESLSTSQSLALTGTGFVWSRYAVVIVPVNYSLLAVNFFVGSTGLYQLSRIYNAKYSKANSATQETSSAAK